LSRLRTESAIQLGECESLSTRLDECAHTHGYSMMALKLAVEHAEATVRPCMSDPGLLCPHLPTHERWANA
jgi:hypothetical protein